MQAKRYLITGGAGFIGSALSHRLIQLGNEVVIIDNLSTGARENIPKGATFIQVDLSNANFVESLPSLKFDAVCHLAAQSSGPRSSHIPYLDLQVNAASTLLLTRWCIANKIYRFLYASSMAVYGNPEVSLVAENMPCLPISYYGVSKLTSENILRLAEAEGLKTTSFRMFSVYGPGQDLNNRDQGMLSIYLSYLLEGSVLPVAGSLERFRDFVYIDDVVNAWINAITMEKTPHRIYNIGSGKKTTVGELIGLLLNELDLSSDYPVEEMRTKITDQLGVFADITRGVGDLNFSSDVDLKAGIRKMVYHYIS